MSCCTSSSDQLVFYDIAAGSPIHPHAPNPWKARYALNFKRANFTTKWVDLSEVKSTRMSLGVAPVRFFANGEPFYTFPLLKDGSTILGDSFGIAVHVDKKYPDSPSLFKHSIGLYAAFNAHIDTVFTAGAQLCAASMPFSPETEEKCKAEFCRRAGVKSYDELIVHGEAKKKVKDAFQAAIGEAAKYFKFSEGPFIGGKEPDYADMIVGGWLMFYCTTIPGDWEDIRGWHGGVWGRLHDALKPYRGEW
ncbi:uncharacterized protein F4822DRAFT_161974 [Hypoxylon trugodes]|uniref:uncharacterized protein n=1 Tax=Hypoxylon trugodes TaxID=326681 RepID=UPI00219FD2BD|nr:uncharacterized protein F4822DRAFT_161974 [Hypoxylon trugodes]KAI1390714.1 hypothetical protein F4822DRAFT_161974 [Hypoxylon trugodes]